MNGMRIIGMFGDDEDARELAKALQEAFERRRGEGGASKPQMHFITPDQLPPPQSEDGAKPTVN